MLAVEINRSKQNPNNIARKFYLAIILRVILVSDNVPRSEHYWRENFHTFDFSLLQNNLLEQRSWLEIEHIHLQKLSATEESVDSNRRD